MDVNVINQEVIVELVTHPRDPRQLPPWTAADVSSGRVSWGMFRNSRWSNLINRRS